jgi:hypothetical protein
MGALRLLLSFYRSWTSAAKQLAEKLGFYQGIALAVPQVLRNQTPL